MKKFFLTLFIYILPSFCCFLFGIPVAIGIVLTAALSWALEIIPISITSLLIPVLGIIFQQLSVEEAFRYFGSELLFLIVGVAFLAHAIKKSGLGERISCMLLSHEFFGSSLQRITYTLTLLCWLMSLWMSNTATCSIMLPIVLGFIHSLEKIFADEQLKRISYRLLFVCSITPGISGIVTPFSALPNIFFYQYLKQKGIEISLFDWVSISFPVSISLVILSVMILDYLYPCKNLEISSEYFLRIKQDLGKWSFEEKIVGFCTIVLTGIWIVGPILEIDNLITPSVAAILVVTPLFFIHGADQCPILVDDKAFPYSAMMLFGGGLCLGGIVEKSSFAENIMKVFTQTGNINFITICLIFSVIILILTELCSNTAAIAIILPIVLKLAHQYELSGELIELICFQTLFVATLGFCMPQVLCPM